MIGEFGGNADAVHTPLTHDSPGEQFAATVLVSSVTPPCTSVNVRIFVPSPNPTRRSLGPPDNPDPTDGVESSR